MGKFIAWSIVVFVIFGAVFSLGVGTGMSMTPEPVETPTSAVTEDSE